jgi:hypothetical protein
MLLAHAHHTINTTDRSPVFISAQAREFISGQGQCRPADDQTSIMKEFTKERRHTVG